MASLNGHTTAELASHIRSEQQQLITEKRLLTTRLAHVCDRLEQLDKAQNLLDGEF